MSEIRKKYDLEFRLGAVRIVEETGKSIAATAQGERPGCQPGNVPVEVTLHEPRVPASPRVDVPHLPPDSGSDTRAG